MDPVVDSNEAMRCEYISTILHTAVTSLRYRTLECGDMMRLLGSHVSEEKRREGTNWYQFWSKAELNQIETLVDTISSFT
ncbi:hypothetical protein RCL_jg9992.t1 [Rhizophagus clarus]|uniref:Uncharacterized protein n=1 Tax=Rhizophagus clarus TaxID=94130 RepID=A0A8H3KV60_9GLOM|nr:hypothetical protein RCL_jg9992.t1 [Rhizophagus clarus]